MLASIKGCIEGKAEYCCPFCKISKYFLFSDFYSSVLSCIVYLQ